jgi:hypothetical protein
MGFFSTNTGLSTLLNGDGAQLPYSGRELDVYEGRMRAPFSYDARLMMRFGVEDSTGSLQRLSMMDKRKKGVRRNGTQIHPLIGHHSSHVERVGSLHRYAVSVTMLSQSTGWLRELRNIKGSAG